MNKRLIQNLQVSLIALDFFILNIIYLISWDLFRDRIPSNYLGIYFKYWVVLNSCWFMLCWMSEVYAEKIILSFVSLSRRTMRTYLIWVLCIFFYLFFFRKIQLSRFFIISTVAVFSVGLLLNRFTYLGIQEYLKRRVQFAKRVLILGYNDLAVKLTRYFEEEGINTQIIGYAEDEDKVKQLTHYPVVANVKNSILVSKEMEVNEIFSTITPEQNENIYELMQQAEIECIRFRIVPDLSLFIRHSVHIDYFRDMPILSLRSEPLDDVNNKVKKRILDIIVSLFVIIFILSWLVPIVGLLIILESPGPIFFKQARTGKDKKTFQCLKFRSMRVNKESDTKQATRNDSRVTRIGKFMRETSLDEFPQFINVFLGEMSVVGPRPHMLKHTEIYSKITEHYMIRQFLKPGITGWAQVNGYRGEITQNEQVLNRINYDIWYLENWSLWLDIKIIFLTAYNIFKGEENAF